MLTVPHSTLAAMGLVATLTWVRSLWAIAALLAALPFFTHHPNSPLAFGLAAVVAALETVYVLRTRSTWRRDWRAASGHPLLLVGALFVVAAFLSLTSLPLMGVWRQHAAVLAGLAVADWPGHLSDWMRLPETTCEFSIRSAILTLQGFILAVIVWRETKGSSLTALYFSAAIALGTFLFIGLGLLEVFGAVSLDVLRSTTHVALRAGTLQSTSGNPSWFSQYVVYSLPFALVILAGPWRIGLRLVLLVAMTAMAGFALLVCFQRGGWLSGSLVIAYMLFATIRLLGTEDTPTPVAWRDMAGAVLLAGVVSTLVAGGFAIWLTGRSTDSARPEMRGFVDRFVSITKGDRLPYLGVSSRIALLHPILGGGHESFAYRYGMYFERQGGPYHRSSLRVPERASAHNVFLQTLTGTGAVGLVLLVASFVVAFWMASRALGGAGNDRHRRVVILASCGSLLGIATYGLVQEVFYIHALRLLFFVNVGLMAGLASNGSDLSPRARRLPWLVLVAAFALHLGYEYVWPGPGRLLRSGEPTGLYGEERGPHGTLIQWTTDRATWPVPQGATTFALRVRSLAPFGQEVTVRACRGTVNRVFLHDHAWRPLAGRLVGCTATDHLELRVAPAWRRPGDERLLGVVTADVSLR